MANNNQQSARRYTTVREQVEYGLETIDPDRTVEVSLRSLMFVFKTMEELNSFFHQRMHYPDYGSVLQFLDAPGGADELIVEAYYQHLCTMVPSDIKAAFDGARFDHTDPPYFFAPTEPAERADP